MTVKRTLLVAAALAAVLVLPSASLAHRPPRSRPGPRRPVKVMRDQFGVPHVFAKTHARRTSLSASCTRATGCSRWTRAAVRRAGRSPSCSARARSRSDAAAADARPAAGGDALACGAVAPEQGDARGLRGRRNAGRRQPAPLRVHGARADEGEHSPLDRAGLDAGHQAAGVRPLVRPSDLSNTQSLVAYQTAGCSGLRRNEALLRGRHAQRAVRARALDLAGRDLGAARKSTGATVDGASALAPNFAAAAGKALENRPRPTSPTEPRPGLEHLGRLGRGSASGRRWSPSDPHCRSARPRCSTRSASTSTAGRSDV